jgi:hypothetical protein
MAVVAIAQAARTSETKTFIQPPKNGKKNTTWRSAIAAVPKTGANIQEKSTRDTR